MPTLRGRIYDRERGRLLEARVHVLASTGQFVAPADAIRKVGGGEPYFYADGEFELELTRGQADVVVERGTEYRPFRMTVDVPQGGVTNLDLALERWIRMPEQGWYAGNTHVHYNETEQRPLDRLRLDPRVEDLPVLIVSVLKRRELPYASNAFPIGHHHLSTPEHVIDVGEESRHNYRDDAWRIALGHIMLINIRELIEPVSRGILVDDSSPDYPPLVDACETARGQGGLVLWCHNANGMEAPIAAALGKLDGLNLFDAYWMDPEYELWYALLNCGIRLPASSGSDWFVCSSNRVYVEVGPSFSYQSWLDGLRAGRTFVTDGPVLRLRVNGQSPSNEVLELTGDRTVDVEVEWESALAVDRVEIVRDGEVVAEANPGRDGDPFGPRVFGGGWARLGAEPAPGGPFGATVTSRVDVDVDVGATAHVGVGQSATSPSRSVSTHTHGKLTAHVDAADAGWIAARCWGRRRNSYGHALWAHTSPVYLRGRPAAARTRIAASLFVERIDQAGHWLADHARFDNQDQRLRMERLFAEGRGFYERLSRG